MSCPFRIVSISAIEALPRRNGSRRGSFFVLIKKRHAANRLRHRAPLVASRSQGAESMTDYQTRDDIAAVPALLALAVPEGQHFLAFDHVTERADGAIPRKYRELIA